MICAERDAHFTTYDSLSLLKKTSLADREVGRTTWKHASHPMPMMGPHEQVFVASFLGMLCREGLHPTRPATALCTHLQVENDAMPEDCFLYL